MVREHTLRVHNGKTDCLRIVSPPFEKKKRISGKRGVPQGALTALERCRTLDGAKQSRGDRRTVRDPDQYFAECTGVRGEEEQGRRRRSCDNDFWRAEWESSRKEEY